MKFLLHLSFVVFATGMYIGCDDENSVVQPNQKDTVLKDTSKNKDTLNPKDTTVIKDSVLTELVPLKIGNYWEYELRYLSKDSVYAKSSGTAEILSDTLIHAKKWYKWSQGHLSTYFSSNYYVWRKNYDAPSLEYKYPVKKGDTYTYDTQYYLPDSSTLKRPRKVTAVDTLINVPAGVFKCIVYTTPPGSDGKNIFKDGTREYFSPGIGLVQDEIYGEAYAEDEYGNVYLKPYIKTRLVLTKAIIK